MEFGAEVNQGFNDARDGISRDPLPDLGIMPEKPTPPTSEVAEPVVSRDMLSRVPQGVLDVSRPDSDASTLPGSPAEAKHRDEPEHSVPEPNEPEHSDMAAAEERRGTPEAATGGGGNKPPKTPETAQGGAYDDGEHGREDNDSNGHDEVLQGMRDAAEATPQVKDTHGDEPTVAPEVNKAVPHPRTSPEKTPADKPVDEALRAPLSSLEEGDAQAPPLDAQKIDDALRQIRGDKIHEAEMNRTDPSHEPDPLGDVADILFGEGLNDEQVEEQTAGRRDDFSTEGLDDSDKHIDDPLSEIEEKLFGDGLSDEQFREHATDKLGELIEGIDPAEVGPDDLDEMLDRFFDAFSREPSTKIPSENVHEDSPEIPDDPYAPKDTSSQDPIRGIEGLEPHDVQPTEFYAQASEEDDQPSGLSDEEIADFLAQQDAAEQAPEGPDFKAPDERGLPGLRGLRSQIGNSFNEGRYASDSDTPNDNSSGLPDPSAMQGSDDQQRDGEPGDTPPPTDKDPEDPEAG